MTPCQEEHVYGAWTIEPHQCGTTPLTIYVLTRSCNSCGHVDENGTSDGLPAA